MGSRADHLQAIDLDDGTVRWRIPLGGRRAVVGAPSVSDGVVFVSLERSGDDAVVALAVDDGTVLRKVFVNARPNTLSPPMVAPGRGHRRDVRRGAPRVHPRPRACMDGQDRAPRPARSVDLHRRLVCEPGRGERSRVRRRGSAYPGIPPRGRGLALVVADRTGRFARQRVPSPGDLEQNITGFDTRPPVRVRLRGLPERPIPTTEGPIIHPAQMCLRSSGSATRSSAGTPGARGGPRSERPRSR